MGKQAAYGMLGRGGEGGEVEEFRGGRNSRLRNEQALDRLTSWFVYENVRNLSSDEATCLGDRVELAGLSWQLTGVVAGQSNASEPSAGGRVPGEMIAGSPPSRPAGQAGPVHPG